MMWKPLPIEAWKMTLEEKWIQYVSAIFFINGNSSISTEKCAIFGS